MKTIKMTVRHGNTIETATATGATVHEAITALKSQQRLGGYVIDNTREAYPFFADTLEKLGHAGHGWADYEIAQVDEAPAHTPEPWEIWRFENADDNASIGAKSGGVSVCEITMRDGEGRANASTIQRGNDNAARIVACVNACDGMADPAAEIKRLRDALDSINRALSTPPLMTREAQEGFSYHSAEEAYRVELCRLIIETRDTARAALEGGIK